MRTAEVLLYHEGFGDLVMRSRTEVITAEYLPHLPPKVAEFMRSDGGPFLDLGPVLGQGQRPSASWACAATLGYVIFQQR
jgi:hypothetical protein